MINRTGTVDVTPSCFAAVPGSDVCLLCARVRVRIIKSVGGVKSEREPLNSPKGPNSHPSKSILTQ